MEPTYLTPFHQKLGRMTLAFWKELYFLKAFANLKGMDHGSTRWVVSSLGIFPTYGVHQRYSRLLLWKTEQHLKWGRGGCRVLPNVVTTT